MFFASTAVVSAEILKIITCFVFIAIEQNGLCGATRHLYENIVQQPVDSLKVSVPGVIYIVTNNLLYVASSNLDAATFQVVFFPSDDYLLWLEGYSGNAHSLGGVMVEVTYIA